MILDATVGWAVSKVLDSAVKWLAEPAAASRALQQSMKLALDDLTARHPKVHAFLHEHGDWEVLWSEVVRYLRDDRPDEKRLAALLRRGRATVPPDLETALDYLLRRVWVRMMAHPALAAFQSIRLAEDILTRLDEFAGVLPPVAEVAVACRAPALAIVDRYAERLHIHRQERLPRLSAGETAVDTDDLVSMVALCRALLIEGEPGIGKTTLLLSLARVLSDRDAEAVVAYVPLPEWVLGAHDIFDFIASRPGFAPRTGQHLRLLALHGRLTLLLDGWNEFAGEKLEKAHSSLDGLQRDYPLVGLVVASRRAVQGPPLQRLVTLRVARLDEETRDASILVRFPQKGPDLIDYLRRSVVLDEVTRIPLYLAIYLDLAAGGEIPSSREQLIARSLEITEAAHRVPLAPLHGHHRDYLEALAVAMFAEGIALPRGSARRSVGATADYLVADRQIAQRPEPAPVLDLLAAHHILVRGEGTDADESFAFQHQQFQEWFASLRVARLAGQVVANDAGAEEHLFAMLDAPPWEEAVGFAVERLSNGREDELARAVVIVQRALKVECLFAARLVRRGGEAIWARVGEDFTAFARRFHRPGEVDRGLAFMIATGRPEFAPTVRGALATGDRNARHSVFGLVDPFPPSVLGGDWRDWYQDLPSEIREEVACEPAYQGRAIGLAFAVEAARVERDATVKAAIIQALDFRDAVRHIEVLLADADDVLWAQVVSERSLECLTNNPEYRRRREDALRAKLADSSSARRAQTLLVLDDMGCNDIRPLIIAELAADDLAVDGHGVDVLIARAVSIDPVATGNIVVERAIVGKEIGWRWRDTGLAPDAEHRRALAEWLVGQDADIHLAGFALGLMQVEEVALLCRAKVENRLVDRLLRGAQPEMLAAVIADQHPQTGSQVLELLDLLADVGRSEKEEQRLPLPPELSARLRGCIHEWLAHPAEAETRRSLQAVAAVVLGRLGNRDDVAVVVDLLRQEIDLVGDRAERFQAWMRSGQRGPDPRHDYLYRYREACAALACHDMAAAMVAALGEAEFSEDAAWILFTFARWEREARGEESGFLSSGYPDFSLAARRRKERAGRTRGPAHAYAAAILDQANRWRLNDADPRHFHLAKGLATLAAGMPYGDRYDDVLENLAVATNASVPRADGYLRLVLAGEAPPVEPAIAGYDAAVAASGKASGKWWPVNEWLRVMAFSERPQEAFDRVRALQRSGVPRHEIHDVFGVLGHCPDPAAGAVLSELAAADPQLLKDWQWITAITQRVEEDVGRALLDIVRDPARCALIEAGRPLELFAHALVCHAEASPAVKLELLEAYAKPRFEATRVVLGAVAEQAIGTAIAEEILDAALALLNDNVRPKIPYTLKRAVKMRAVTHEPAGGGAYYMVPAPASALRARLLRMSVEDKQRRECATYLLDKIDRLRSEYGYPGDEPRHPDLASGRPWPPCV